MKKLLIGLVSLAGLAYSGDAHALSCDEIMNMVNVNVPTSIIVQTMEDSGETFSNDDIRCLLNEGAPDDVVKTAKSMSASVSKPDTPSDDRDKPDVKKSTEDDWDTTERIGEKKSRKDAYEDLPEEGEGSRNAGGECGRRVDDAVSSLKAKKPLSASKKLFDLLAEGTPGPLLTLIQRMLEADTWAVRQAGMTLNAAQAAMLSQLGYADQEDQR